mmetsp:Transcript_23995/g.72075  ORF Transcript_23995/g.72075 Transcript_23995/m.72075 type:complete len:468 (-) Transcript_23995:145-1548(-)
MDAHSLQRLARACGAGAHLAEQHLAAEAARTAPDVPQRQAACGAHRHRARNGSGQHRCSSLLIRCALLRRCVDGDALQPAVAAGRPSGRPCHRASTTVCTGGAGGGKGNCAGTHANDGIAGLPSAQLLRLGNAKAQGRSCGRQRDAHSRKRLGERGVEAGRREAASAQQDQASFDAVHRAAVGRRHLEVDLGSRGILAQRALHRRRQAAAAWPHLRRRLLRQLRDAKDAHVVELGQTEDRNDGLGERRANLGRRGDLRVQARECDSRAHAWTASCERGDLEVGRPHELRGACRLDEPQIRSVTGLARLGRRGAGGVRAGDPAKAAGVVGAVDVDDLHEASLVRLTPAVQADHEDPIRLHLRPVLHRQARGHAVAPGRCPRHLLHLDPVVPIRDVGFDSHLRFRGLNDHVARDDTGLHIHVARPADIARQVGEKIDQCRRLEPGGNSPTVPGPDNDLRHARRHNGGGQ